MLFQLGVPDLRPGKWVPHLADGGVPPSCQWGYPSYWPGMGYPPPPISRIGYPPVEEWTDKQPKNSTFPILRMWAVTITHYLKDIQVMFQFFIVLKFRLHCALYVTTAFLFHEMDYTGVNGSVHTLHLLHAIATLQMNKFHSHSVRLG